MNPIEESLLVILKLTSIEARLLASAINWRSRKLAASSASFEIFWSGWSANSNFFVSAVEIPVVFSLDMLMVLDDSFSFWSCQIESQASRHLSPGWMKGRILQSCVWERWFCPLAHWQTGCKLGSVVKIPPEQINDWFDWILLLHHDATSISLYLPVWVFKFILTWWWMVNILNSGLGQSAGVWCEWRKFIILSLFFSLSIKSTGESRKRGGGEWLERLKIKANQPTKRDIATERCHTAITASVASCKELKRYEWYMWYRYHTHETHIVTALI